MGAGALCWEPGPRTAEAQRPPRRSDPAQGGVQRPGSGNDPPTSETSSRRSRALWPSGYQPTKAGKCGKGMSPGQGPNFPVFSTAPRATSAAHRGLQGAAKRHQSWQELQGRQNKTESPEAPCGNSLSA